VSAWYLFPTRCRIFITYPRIYSLDISDRFEHAHDTGRDNRARCTFDIFYEELRTNIRQLCTDAMARHVSVELCPTRDKDILPRFDRKSPVDRKSVNSGFLLSRILLE